MTVDLTGIGVAVIAGVFGVVGPAFLLWLQGHIKDQAAAKVIGAAVSNALGAIQQAVEAGLIQTHPQIEGVPAPLAPGVQYVLNNAAAELERYPNITPPVIAEKIAAKIGLRAIDNNIATAAARAAMPTPTSGATP